jgi:hypothetical protein
MKKYGEEVTDNLENLIGKREKTQFRRESEKKLSI